jgi:spore coat protein CotF
MEVHEVLNEKLNMIHHFSFYARQCQDSQLKEMIDRQLQTAIQSYDHLVGYTHDYSAAPSQGMNGTGMRGGAGMQGTQRYAGGVGQGQGMPSVQPNQIAYGLRQPAPVAPQLQGEFNDKQIACSVLSCHKNSAKNQMAASLECADPNVRQMLVEGAIVCSNQAYETFLWMNRQGQYQVPTLQDQTAKTFLHTYQPAQTQQAQGSYQ